MRFLLEQGANRDCVDNYGCTPLHWAAQRGHLEVAKLLMVYRANLNARDEDGELPVQMEGYHITEEMAQAIRDEPRRRMDEAPGKRAIEQDRHPIACSSASAQHDDEVEEVAENHEQSNKKPRLDEGAVVEEGKVAEEDEDSEPSSDENDGN